MAKPPLVLLTGATGYVGGRLLPALEGAGHTVRCLTRRPEALRHGHPGRDVVRGDVLERSSLDAALRGVDVAYYLVHSMGAAGSFEAADRHGATNFAAAARAAGVGRIVYLGGLGREDEELSPHLRSRHEVGRILRESGLPVLEFRASIVIGSGSLSFEMIRSLVDRLPIMITPKWVRIPAQPIAVDDLLEYLLEALTLPAAACRVYEIGGADRVSYADIMRLYARLRGRRLRMLAVPLLTPYVSSLWLGLITPLYARVGRKLIESIVHSTVVRDDLALRTFAVRPMGVEAAVRRALGAPASAPATRWNDAVSSARPRPSWQGVRFGRQLRDARSIPVAAPAAVVFACIERIGGDTGWYAWNGLWRLRGGIDLLAGGVGMRRGRPSADRLRVGDTLDFWRVEAIEPGVRLRLSAEMRLPGRAWLEFTVREQAGFTTLHQVATFDPHGLLGQVYWYALYPLHHLVFGGMLRGIARAALRPAVPG